MINVRQAVLAVVGFVGAGTLLSVGGYALNAYAESLVEEDVTEYVGSLVSEDSVLLARIIAIEEYNREQEKTQRAQLDSQLRTECMNFKHQNLSAEDRYRVCEQESKDRRAWWAWKDCVDAGNTTCGREPPKPQGIG